MPIKSDPWRLQRRNHCQEGSGFLFVADAGRTAGRRRGPAVSGDRCPSGGGGCPQRRLTLSKVTPGGLAPREL
jgi:hypothetical protein